MIQKPPKVETQWDKSFILQLLLIFPIVLLCIPTSFNRSSQFPDHPMPNIKELLPSVFSLIFFLATRYIFADNLFLKIAPKVVYRKPDWNDTFTQFRYERFGITFYKFLYYLMIAPLGVYLFQYEDWMPHSLFGKGKGDMKLIYENFPYVPQTPNLIFFYCLELGYHLHSLIYHLLSTPRNDYYETLLHHVATIFLVIFSYVNNCGRIGICVMILHDIVDAVMYFTKCTNDFKNQIPCYIGFVFLATSYARFRLYVLAFHVIPAGYMAKYFIPEGTVGGYIVYYLLVGMLCSLLILHIYWYKLIIGMILKVFNKQGVVDPHAGKQRKNEL